MRINEVILLSDYTLRIVSDEGFTGNFNVKPYLKYEVFQPLQKISEFMKISNGGYFVELDRAADLSADTIEAKKKFNFKNSYHIFIIMGAFPKETERGNTMNTIDKVKWQATLAQYKTWNEAKFRESMRNARKVPLLHKWRKFLAMMDFGLMLKPHPSEHEQKQKIEMLTKYYNQIQRFEARRKRRGKSV